MSAQGEHANNVSVFVRGMVIIQTSAQREHYTNVSVFVRGMC